MDQLSTWIQAHPLLATALSSLWGAVLLDLVTFTRAKEPGDFFGQFSVRVAGFKYLQALVAGFIGNFAVAGAAGAMIGLVLWMSV